MVRPAWTFVGGFMCSNIIRKGTVKYLHMHSTVSE